MGINKCNHESNQPIMRIEPYYNVFSTFIIDPFIVFFSIYLTFILILIGTWWSISLSIIIFIVSLGLFKSLFLKEIILYEKNIILKWYFFGCKAIVINEIKEIRTLTVTWSWKFTLLKKQPFDHQSIWCIINESVLSHEEYINLENTMKELIGRNK